jgi:NADH:ubiquinone oxidoreductase subunit E
MKITVCLGSACHVKGSSKIVEELQYLISENNLTEKVELSGKFCMDKCLEGVNVTLDDKEFSLSPETLNDFFQKEVLLKIK